MTAHIIPAKTSASTPNEPLTMISDNYIDIDLKSVVPFPMRSRSYVYILKCENDKWYVGYTETKESRVRSHFDGGASKWTRKHKPIALVATIYGDIKLEVEVTLRMMAKFGIDNVRGAHWCHTDYPVPKKQIRKIKRGIRKNGYECNWLD